MIRRLTTADRQAWQNLWEGYLHFYRGDVSSADTEVAFARLVAGDDMVGLVAVDDSDDAIGFAHLIFHHSTWSSQPYCYLEDLFVARTARGSGAAKELIQAVYGEADQRGAARTYWETQEFNSPARSLYDTIGHRTSFVIYER